MYENRIEILQKYAGQLETFLTEEYPRGSLCVENGRYRWYRPDGTRTYLNPGADESLIRQLSEKRFYYHALASVKKELQACKCYEHYKPKHVIESVWASLPEEIRKYADPLPSPSENFVEEWRVQPVREYYKYPERKTAVCSNGLMVRSKSEMMIAECLLSYDIPFRYESGVKMDGFGWIYPDFTILHVPTRKEVIWEHFGKTDDLVYLQRMAGKLRLYQKNDGLSNRYEKKGSNVIKYTGDQSEIYK